MPKPKDWLSDPYTWSKLKTPARENRHEATKAEEILWQALRAQKLTGHKFRRQHPIGSFLLDFYCSKAKLGIEIDGAIHRFNISQDKARQEYIEASGIKVIRFTNAQIINSVVNVLEKIEIELQDRTTSPYPLRGFPLSVDGEGTKRRGA